MASSTNRSIYLLTFIFSLVSSTHLYGQNAIDFDGIDDHVEAPNASALIANSDVSMAFWVYLTNPAPGYPDFDGIVGFRNDFDADFYVLQLSSTSLEVRFRNSNGTDYTMAYNSPNLLNTWNHFTVTYDGSTLSLYHNGSPASSISASGVITSTTSSFYMGMLPFSNPNFYLDGRLDDVGLWNTALSPTDANNLYNACSIDISDPNLQLCYEFNQGIAAGDNVGITSVTDSKGNINGSMNNFQLTGTVSNFIEHGNPTVFAFSDTTACSYTSPSGNYTWNSTGTYVDTLVNAAGCDSIITVDLLVLGTTNSITVTECGSYDSPSGNYTWHTSGVYTDTLVASAGCDSVLTINLTIDTVDVGVSQSGANLSANQSGATYQWLNCPGMTPINGATNQLYTATANGDYAVIVTINGCSDTSNCYTVNGVGILEHDFGDELLLYPNPTNGFFSIDLGKKYPTTRLTLTDLSGRLVDSKNYTESQVLNMEIQVPAGVYLLQVECTDPSASQAYKKAVIRLVKE